MLRFPARDVRVRAQPPLPGPIRTRHCDAGWSPQGADCDLGPQGIQDDQEDGFRLPYPATDVGILAEEPEDQALLVQYGGMQTTQVLTQRMHMKTRFGLKASVPVSATLVWSGLLWSGLVRSCWIWSCLIWSCLDRSCRLWKPIPGRGSCLQDL